MTTATITRIDSGFANAGRDQEPRPSVDYPRPLARVTEGALA